MVKQTHNNFETKASLPNASASLVLGIVSICGSFIFGLIGLICGIIGLVLANKDKKLYFAEDGVYSTSSYSTSNAGRICSIIGIVIGALSLIILIVAFLFFVSTTSSSTPMKIIQ